ncbi:alpha/beta hydrolase fold [Serratia fonticola]|uniref:Alpha/beta hydrolase fold n=1 Tax=Serratia fonticola TaxID=47917 RepID=A0A4U9WD06_SERFO|nr:alpha/beta hydrolase fold [Serratia fonticola]
MGIAERLDIFPAARQPAPLFVFIHGGYWHSQTKEDACSMAHSFTQHNVTLATLEYTLLPRQRWQKLSARCAAPFPGSITIARSFGIDPERIFIGGSSAGGHLSGMLIADDWQTSYRVPPQVIKGALALSGLFDIRPLCDIYINDWMRQTPEQAKLLSPMFLLPEKRHAPQILLSVGAKETTGFKHQTQAYYAACKEKGLDVQIIEDQENNHFTLVNELADTQSNMFKHVMAMIHPQGQ